MKKLTLLFAVILFANAAFAQDDDVQPQKSALKNKRIEKTTAKTHCPIVYINVSTGINNNAGFLGPGVVLAVAEHVSVDMGLGLSTWGYKYYAGAKYYLKPCQTGWAFGGGLTYSTGLSNFNYNLETVYGNTEQVVLDLLPQTNIFIAAYKYWNLGKSNTRFYLELGWSVRATQAQFRQTSGDQISDNSVKTVNVLSPGGLIVGTGFSFGIPRHK